MKDIVLINLLEKAKKQNKAVQLEGDGGIDMEHIEPDEKYFFQDDCLILEDRIFDCSYIAFAKLTKNAAERELEFTEHLNKVWGYHEEV